MTSSQPPLPGLGQTPEAVKALLLKKLYEASTIWQLAFTVDDFRYYLHLERVSVRPVHPNGWGALFSAAAKKGWIEPTGRYVKSTRAPRNGGRVMEWRRKA